MKLFHRAPAAETILRAGFRDAAGAYLTDRARFVPIEEWWRDHAGLAEGGARLL